MYWFIILFASAFSYTFSRQSHGSYQAAKTEVTLIFAFEYCEIVKMSMPSRLSVSETLIMKKKYFTTWSFILSVVGSLLDRHVGATGHRKHEKLYSCG